MSIKFAFGFLVGATVAGAIVHFLNTEEGKAFMNGIKRDAAKVEEDLVNMAEDFVEKGNEIIDEMDGFQTA